MMKLFKRKPKKIEVELPPSNFMVFDIGSSFARGGLFNEQPTLWPAVASFSRGGHGGLILVSDRTCKKAVGFEAIKRNGYYHVEYSINSFGRLYYPQAYTHIVEMMVLDELPNNSKLHKLMLVFPYSNIAEFQKHIPPRFRYCETYWINSISASYFSNFGLQSTETALIVEMGNHTINAVPVIDGNVDVTENCKYEKTPLAGEVINIFMLQLIKKLNELTEGVIITKDDIMLEKKLYEVTDDLHKSFVLHGYQNPVKILNEEFSNVNSYMHYLPSELIKNVQTYLKHNPSNSTKTVISELGYFPCGKEKIPKRLIKEIPVGIERVLSPEILFKPELIEAKHNSLVQTIVKTISKNEEKHQDKLLKNIVLTGGLSEIKGIGERLRKELEAVYPGKTLKIVVNKDGGMSAWKGAAEVVKSGNVTSYKAAVK